MRKSLLALLALLAGLPLLIYAANTCVNTDQVCYVVGPSQSPTTVFRVDASGNITGSGNETISGNQTVTGNNAITGNNTVTGTSTNTGAVTDLSSTTSIGQTIYSPTNYTNVFASATIPVTASYITITSSGGTLPLTGTPTIATTTLTSANWSTIPAKSVAGIKNIPDGTFLIIGSTSTQAITIQDNSIIANSLVNVSAVGGRTVISSTAPAAFIFNASAGTWSQVGRP
jgi:hypothetical protein